VPRKAAPERLFAFLEARFAPALALFVTSLAKKASSPPLF